MIYEQSEKKVMQSRLIKDSSGKIQGSFKKKNELFICSNVLGLSFGHIVKKSLYNHYLLKVNTKIMM